VATGIVVKVHIHPVFGGEGNSVGKADPVWGEGPCTAVVDCVMCAFGLPDHPCVVSSTLAVVFFVHVVPHNGDNTTLKTDKIATPKCKKNNFFYILKIYSMA
tara:strand:- start:403 stop:708 length:306 start_codon:yes stop_codon:yes gene_type:complete